MANMQGAPSPDDEQESALTLAISLALDLT